jgi:hypothetical protein
MSDKPPKEYVDLQIPNKVFYVFYKIERFFLIKATPD